MEKSRGELSEKCPPILAELIKKKGSRKLAAQAAGLSASGHFFNLLSGKQQMSDRVKANIEAALRGEKVIPIGKTGARGSYKTVKVAGTALLAATVPAESPKPEPPPFTPWDGKNVPVVVAGKAGTTQKFKKCPIPIAELLKRHGGSRLAAAQAMGYSGAGVITDVLNEEKPFSNKLQQRVYNALNGISHRDSDISAQDTFSVGLAVCVLSLTNYERLEEMAEVLDGAMIMRRALGTAGWLVIWRFPHPDKTKTFKRLANRDAKDIVCP